MKRWLRRLFWLGVLVGGGYGAYTALNRRRSSAVTAPQWPAVPVVRPDTEQSAPVSTDAGPQRWVEPINGDCPDGYPVKANDNSRIYHVPGGRFYERTAAERCYANADDALADGYRPAKA